MSERQRLRREDPERAEPIRNWSNLYRRADSWSPAAPRADRINPDGVAHNRDDDDVDHGVRTGYRVIEEHIREISRGQKVARQINHGPYDSGSIGDDVLDVIERLYRYSRDLLPVCFEIAGSLMRAPQFLRDLAYPGKRESAPPSAAPQDIPIAIEVRSTRPTRITLDLRPHYTGIALGVRGLQAIDATMPPLLDVEFVAVNGSEGAALRISVPDSQPAAIYSAVVADLATGEPRGTLSV